MTQHVVNVMMGDDVPDTLPDPESGEPAFAVGWHNVDAWRGHYDVTPLDGAAWSTPILESWVTGDWSDAPAGHSASEMKEQVDALELEHGDVCIVLVPTSNVFSTAVTVFAKASEAPDE